MGYGGQGARGSFYRLIFYVKWTGVIFSDQQMREVSIDSARGAIYELPSYRDAGSGHLAARVMARGPASKSKSNLKGLGWSYYLPSYLTND